MEMHNTGFPRFQSRRRHRGPGKSQPIDILCRGGVRKLRFQFSPPESSEPARQRNQKGSIGGLTQALYHGCPKWNVVEPGGPGPPSPNSVTPHYPEHVMAIFKQAKYSLTECTARSIAVNVCSIERAELSSRCLRVVADPNRILAILKDRGDKKASKVRVPSESSIFPARQAFHCADPESAVTGNTKIHHKIAGKLFAILRWLPMLGANTVEPKQPEARAQPDVAVWRLRN